MVGLSIAIAVFLLFWLSALFHLFHFLEIPMINPVVLAMLIMIFATFMFDWREFEVVKHYSLIGVLAGGLMTVISRQLSLGDYFSSVRFEVFLTLSVAVLIRLILRGKKSCQPVSNNHR